MNKSEQMYKIIHISDLHFGRENDVAVNALTGEIKKLDPDVMVISGDLTQRAKRKEYVLAKKFVDSVACPKVIIPGNHDIPLYNIFQRLTNPFERFDSFFPEAEYDFYSDDKVNIFGLNSVRARRWKSGKVSEEEMKEIEFSDSLKSEKLRIATLHHNLVYRSHIRDVDKFLRTNRLIRNFKDNDIDLILFGHDHKKLVRGNATDKSGPSDLIFIQAGSSISNRLRGEPNSYNIIFYENNSLTVKSKELRQDIFIESADHNFYKKSGKWAQEANK